MSERQGDRYYKAISKPGPYCCCSLGYGFVGLPPAPTCKRGRPRKYGDQIDIKSLQYEKVGDYYIATRQVLTNLFETQPIEVTVTVTDIETFDSVKVFITTIQGHEIKIFKEHNVASIDYEPQRAH